MTRDLRNKKGAQMHKVSSVNSIGTGWVGIFDEWEECSVSRSPSPKTSEELTDQTVTLTSASDNISTAPFCIFASELEGKDREKIASLLKDLAQKHIIQLGMDSKNLHQRGMEIKKVHPMRFIGHILTDSVLFNHLEVIKTKSIIYGNFTKEFVDHMKEKEASNDLLEHAGGFARHVGVAEKIVVDIIRNKQYANFMQIKPTTSK